MRDGRGLRWIFDQLGQLDPGIIYARVVEIFLELSWLLGQARLYSISEAEDSSTDCVTLLQAFDPSIERYHAGYSSTIYLTCTM
jgi:hypothetical protein